MVIRKKLLFLVIILLVFSACSRKTEVSDIAWQDEILFASECGMDGLQCCMEEEEPCQYEQECCVDPNDPASTYCADECSFGEPNTFCRASDSKCDEGAVCSGGYCQIAGGDNQPCFYDGTCGEGSVCGNGICVECGLAGNPCCEGISEYECENENMDNGERTDCIASVCLKCGSASEPSCLDEPNCNPGHLQNNSTCLLCGGYNQPCCQGEDGGDSFCWEKENLSCSSGFCSRI
ncbi:MAG: hypothetical protein PF572_05335 [Patescibacteria group bacterium]|jgi:hypothetical protein|nr:hypothetical protein [Patescibacteria group bacterium]